MIAWGPSDEHTNKYMSIPNTALLMMQLNKWQQHNSYFKSMRPMNVGHYSRIENIESFKDFMESEQEDENFNTLVNIMLENSFVEGYDIYVFFKGSFFRHSCNDFNCSWGIRTHSNKIGMGITTIRDIQKGEYLTIDKFSNSFRKPSRLEIVKEMREIYCECEDCVNLISALKNKVE
jgi:hypothetical protein